MDRKLKVLCLHGYTQHAEKFRIHTGGVRKFLKPYADFTFISAPHLIRHGDDEQRSWWFTRPNGFSSRDETNEDTGFDESLRLVENTFKESGPFDGILGFSQGAAFTALLCALKQRNEIKIDFNFAVIISGFISRCSKHFQYYTEKINIPSLHVIGERDEIIYKSWSEALADTFVDPVIIIHDGGHHVPSRSSLKDKYRDFFSKQMKNTH